MARAMQPPMKIKIKRPGAFTARAKAAGKSIQGEAAAILKPGSKASPLAKKQANFARNAAKWNHAGRKGK